MPYKIEKQGDKWCVVRSDTGESKGCSDSKEEAQAHMSALYANENKADNKPSSADDYAYVPDPKTPSGWKLPIDNPEHIAAAITALTTGFRGNKVQIPADAKGKVVSRIRAAINKLSDKDQKANLLDRLSKVKELAEKAFTGKLEPEDVNYIPYSNSTSKACANCRWFLAGAYPANACFIVDASDMDDEPILPTGLCDRWETNPKPVQPEPEPIPVTIVEPPMSMDDSAEMALPTTRRGLKTLVMDMLKGFIAQPQEKMYERPFTAWKGTGENYYWLARHTGKWVDREGEIIADHSHEEFVTRVQKGLVPMPELWTWHKKGTMHGVADFVWKSGGFILALGHFTGTKEQKERAVAYYQKHGDKIKLSHMFKYPKQGKRGKVYHAYNTVEITTLPDGAEAFPYTTFEGLSNMPFTKEQEEMIRGIGGDDMLQRAQAADTKALTDTVKLDAAGVASKTANADNFEGSVIPGDDEIKAMQVATKDLDARLKKLEALPTSITSLEASFKSIDGKLADLSKSLNDNLAKANAVEQKLLEYQAVAPPATKSKDTLLNEREKSLVNQLSESAKSADTVSLIDRMVGNQPVVSGN